MVRADGVHETSGWRRRLAGWHYGVRDRLVRRIDVQMPSGPSLTFLCHSDVEEKRATTLFIKEAGTIRWLDEYVQQGEVFVDVGANIGLYTLLAARRVGSTGRVYAFEPHLANAWSLMQNVAVNGMQDWVTVFSVPLHDSAACLPFHYYSATPGSSMSQLDSDRDGYERAFLPCFTEWKVSARLDDLVHSQTLRPPQHIKIDVDGNELCVLRGMGQVLATGQLQSMQIEMNERYSDELRQFVSTHGYVQRLRHDTRNGLAQISAGRDPSEVAHNAVFTLSTPPTLDSGATAC